MAGFVGALLVSLQFLILTRCMEVDFCVPVRVEEDGGPRRGEQRTEDKHVVFRLSAFQQEFFLHLTPDSSFLPPAESGSGSGGLRECFYSGGVNGDPESFAALSLCKGLNGGFSYNGMEYFISAAAAESGTHRIRRRRSAALAAGGNGTSRCGVPPDTNVSFSLDKYRHMRELGVDGWTETILRTLGRSKRFASIPRFVEVLVVADESMVKFHGDDLKHYLLTLMSVAARLYKHPSILNSISIVVVGFMVMSEADKGPKVSSNAALTLRNFCSWQKKLNKPSDKHPEYWDTAILFTKQASRGRAGAAPSGSGRISEVTAPLFELYFCGKTSLNELL